MFGRILICILLLPLPGGNSASRPQCRALVHIGDSTSVPIVGRLRENYKAAGFKNVYVSAGNGRSLAYSTPPDAFSGVEVIKHYRKILGRGICWVIALGTNDAASSMKPSDSSRIQMAMRAIDGEPVVWVNVWMASKSRPNYSAAAAREWNALLVEKMHSFPNAFILDWASKAKKNPSWFSGDGYHYGSSGYKKRSEIIPQYAASMLR